MGLYSDAILKQMGQIGEPVRTKATTTVKPPGPEIDIMQLLMMLMFSGAFQQKGGQKPGMIGDIAGEPMSAMQYGLQGGAAPTTTATPTGMGAMTGTGGTGSLAALMKLLMSIPGMGGMR